jgi:hypothetical protein
MYYENAAGVFINTVWPIFCSKKAEINKIKVRTKLIT